MRAAGGDPGQVTGVGDDVPRQGQGHVLVVPANMIFVRSV